MKNRAIEFEKSGKSRTFIVYNESDQIFKVLGYYSLAIQIFKIPEEYSNRQRKILDGFNAKIKGEKITEIPAYLIGQFAKNDLYKGFISGNLLMQFCLNSILDAQQKVAGRLVILECKDEPKLIEFYNRFDFKKVEKNYSEDEFIQLIRVFSKEENVCSDSDISLT